MIIFSFNVFSFNIPTIKFVMRSVWFYFILAHPNVYLKNAVIAPILLCMPRVYGSKFSNKNSNRYNLMLLRAMVYLHKSTRVKVKSMEQKKTTLGSTKATQVKVTE